MNRIRTKEDFENWKLFLMFRYGDEPKSSIDETNYINLFSEDWNELMEVINKIEELEITSEVKRSSVTVKKIFLKTKGSKVSLAFSNGGFYIEEIFKDGSKFENTYKALVEFIKWYNENIG